MKNDHKNQFDQQIMIATVLGIFGAFPFPG